MLVSRQSVWADASQTHLSACDKVLVWWLNRLPKAWAEYLRRRWRSVSYRGNTERSDLALGLYRNVALGVLVACPASHGSYTLINAVALCPNVVGSATNRTIAMSSGVP